MEKVKIRYIGEQKSSDRGMLGKNNVHVYYLYKEKEKLIGRGIRMKKYGPYVISAVRNEINTPERFYSTHIQIHFNEFL
jgi:hypothetical protein